MNEQPTNNNPPTDPGNMFASNPFLPPLPPEPAPGPPRGRWHTALDLVRRHMLVTVGAVVITAGAGFVLVNHMHPAPSATEATSHATTTATNPTTSTTTPSASSGKPTAGQTVSPNSGTQTQIPAQATKTTAGGSTQTTNNSNTASSGGSGTGNSGSSGGTPSSTWWSSSTAGSGSLIPASQLNSGNCSYDVDTWSGDAASVGYTTTLLSHSDGNPASFSVRLNADSNNQEVVGYPSVQCLLYEAMPSNLNSSFHITPPTANGLNYEYAYDIWLTTTSKATASDWSNDLELMIWNYDDGQEPSGYWDTPNHAPTATLSDGSTVYTYGSSSTGTVSVVLPSNMTSGNVNITSLVALLKTRGYVPSSDNGILDVEYGIEAPYGGNQTFTVNSLSLMN